MCQAGVQQGDPLVPMLFSLWLHGAIKAVDGVPGRRQLWYLYDDSLRGQWPLWLQPSRPFDLHYLTATLRSIPRSARPTPLSARKYLEFSLRFHGLTIMMGGHIVVSRCMNRPNSGTVRRMRAVYGGITRLAATSPAQACTTTAGKLRSLPRGMFTPHTASVPQYCRACTDLGREADTFGALQAQARDMVSALITKTASHGPLPPAKRAVPSGPQSQVKQ